MRQKAELNYEEEILDLFFLPNIILVVKSSGMEWAGHLARMGGEERYTQGFEKET
jgi:hypothetical protein